MPNRTGRPYRRPDTPDDPDWGDSDELLDPIEGFVARALDEYRFTDHPLVWTPTICLYAAYGNAWNNAMSYSTSEHVLDEQGGRPLSLRQFGAVLSRVYDGWPRVVRRFQGVQYRGIGGLCGPQSLRSSRCGEYPDHLCEYPPPEDWTPADSVRTLPSLIDPRGE